MTWTWKSISSSSSSREREHGPGQVDPCGTSEHGRERASRAALADVADADDRAVEIARHLVQPADRVANGAFGVCVRRLHVVRERVDDQDSDVADVERELLQQVQVLRETKWSTTISTRPRSAPAATSILQ
jgi:hypothetical protein